MATVIVDSDDLVLAYIFRSLSLTVVLVAALITLRSLYLFAPAASCLFVLFYMLLQLLRRELVSTLYQRVYRTTEWLWLRLD